MTDDNFKRESLRRGSSKEQYTHNPASSARTTFFSIPELLALVFSHSLSSYYLFTESIPSLTSPPLIFTHVNRQWREVALATPHLWADLSLICFPTIPSLRLANNHHQILTEWLARSKNIPLSLSLKYAGDTVGDVIRIERILSAILPHAERWRDLQVAVPMPCLRAILKLMEKDSPILERCKLCITSTRRYSEEGDLVLDFDSLSSFRHYALTLDLGAASKLKELDMETEAQTDIVCIGLPSSLQTLRLDNFNLLLGPPWVDNIAFRCAGLKKLELHSSIDVELVRQLAVVFPGLEEAFLDVKSEIQQEGDRDDENGSVKFPKLHTLNLCAVQVRPSRSGTADMHTLDILLSRLCLPSLKRLNLTVSYALLGHEAWPALHSFLVRSHASLRELKIVGVLFEEASVLSLLCDVGSTVQKVSLCVRATDEVMTALTLREDKEGGGLCPYLTHLDIPLSSPCSADSVIAMLRSRCSPTAAFEYSPNVSRGLIQKCRLILSEPGAVEGVERHPEIERYVEQGLSLDVQPYYY